MAKQPKIIEVNDLDDASINQPAVASAMGVMRDQAQEDQAEVAELAIGIGAIQAFDLVKSFTSAAQVKLFKRIRESKQIKHLPIRLRDGGVKSFHSMREACPVLFGRTYESMVDAEEKFDTFGEMFYEGASRLRLHA